MTKKEFAILADALKTFYPREGLLPNTHALELWYRELQDIPYNIAELSLRKWVNTNKWPPTIADLREMAAGVQNGDVPEWSEAWESTLRAIRKFGSYRPQEALESLDPLTRKVVERLGFRELCMSEKIEVDRANFRMIFEQLVSRQRQDQQMALPLREAIGMIQIETKSGFVQIGTGKENSHGS